MIDSTLKNANILIVDDQVANIEVLEELLELYHYTNVKTTTDPRKVVDLFKSFKPDLILLDLAMPFLSGFDVMEQLKSLVPANTLLPILVLTADVTHESKQRALREGASDFLTKPFDLVEVGLRIKNLLFTSYLLQLLGNQKDILEEKVKKRTSELQKTNVALMIARDKAEASDRLKTAFMNNISHEIRTPLNGILGFAPMVLDPVYSAKDKQEFLEVLQISGKRLIQTVSDFMDISLIASGNIEVRHDHFTVSEILSVLESQYLHDFANKNLQFTVEIPSMLGLLVLNSDRLLLNKILRHLLDNALKFTQKGSVLLSVSHTGQSLTFGIKDTGIGISEKVIPSIFDHFTQEDTSNTRNYEGSGLGLSITKGLAELLGGSISAESVKGEGSTFLFAIPHILSEPWAEKAETISPISMTEQKPVVLIVDDEYSGTLFLKSTLQNTFDLLFAKNGEEAVELCKSNPGIKLVLMDMKLPEMNGYIATRKIKEFRNDLPVVAVTAYAMAGDRKKCLDAGCDEYLSKPLSKNELFPVLKKFGFNGQ
ncbi:MAG: response regulator [Bacteroidota bacterium]